MVEVLDTVRVNTRQQKLHVRSFRPQHSPKALLVWHHGEQSSGSVTSWVSASSAPVGATSFICDAAGYGEHLLRYNHCESLACINCVLLFSNTS